MCSTGYSRSTRTECCMHAKNAVFSHACMVNKALLRLYQGGRLGCVCIDTDKLLHTHSRYTFVHACTPSMHAHLAHTYNTATNSRETPFVAAVRPYATQAP